MYGLNCGLAPLACASYALPTFATAALPACGLGLNLACGASYLW